MDRLVLRNESPVCLSGGAKGADHAWGLLARDRGHQVIHWSFNGHRTTDPDDVIVLESHLLEQADAYLKKASKSMRRAFPARDLHVNNLLRRNWFQVRWSDRVYAVAQRKDDGSMLGISGGTAWACQMYVDRWYEKGGLIECELYLFDQVSCKWMQWLEEWRVISHPPSPHGVYAGIGTRDLSDPGLEAIFRAYG